MSAVKPVIFSNPSRIKVEEYFLDQEKLISGNPKQSLWLEYTDTTNQFFSGVWASEEGEWQVAFTEEEYCRIIDGVSVITAIDGESFTVKAGDEFVIPAGFKGTWKVVEPTRKRFVSYENNH